METQTRKLKQKDLAADVQISTSYLSEIINRKKNPSWTLAKKLATATRTNPVLWMEGTREDIRNIFAFCIRES